MRDNNTETVLSASPLNLCHSSAEAVQRAEAVARRLGLLTAFMALDLGRTTPFVFAPLARAFSRGLIGGMV